MAIKFLNIKSGEVRVAETEPHIAAMWASSDHSPNITQGQDFGWRLAPEVVVEMKRIKQDFNTLMQIAQRIGKNVDEVGEPDILLYISSKYDATDTPVAQQGDYESDYDDEIRRLSQVAEKENQAHVSREVDQVPPTETDVIPQSGVAQSVPPTNTDETATTTQVPPTETTTTTEKPAKPNKPATK